jgi:hypothetical protein
MLKVTNIDLQVVSKKVKIYFRDTCFYTGIFYIFAIIGKKFRFI